MLRAREFASIYRLLRALNNEDRLNRNNVPKGYSFVSLTQNLEVMLASIGSIPSAYDWTRTNTTAFKGIVRPFHYRRAIFLNKFLCLPGYIRAGTFMEVFNPSNPLNDSSSPISGQR